MSMSSMKDYIDPNMMDLYPHDCLFKVIYNDRFMLIADKVFFFFFFFVGWWGQTRKSEFSDNNLI
jgi:hypothetical protein